MEQWQIWSLRRTENPRELDRNQPAPLHGDDSSVGQKAGLWIRKSRVQILLQAQFVAAEI